MLCLALFYAPQACLSIVNILILYTNGIVVSGRETTLGLQVMKRHFENDLTYQKAAIESIVSLFKGQEISRSEFTVAFQPHSYMKGSSNLSLIKHVRSL